MEKRYGIFKQMWIDGLKNYTIKKLVSIGNGNQWNGWYNNQSTTWGKKVQDQIQQTEVNLVPKT